MLAWAMEITLSNTPAQAGPQEQAAQNHIQTAFK